MFSDGSKENIRYKRVKTTIMKFHSIPRRCERKAQKRSEIVKKDKLIDFLMD